MFYRVRGIQRITVDVADLYAGESCFLVGGGYQLASVREQLNDPRIVTMAMNNAATQFTPNLWIGADQPGCYSHSILFNPTITKFIYMCYIDAVIGGRKLKQLANMYFMSRKDAQVSEFFEPRKQIGWWGNVFTLALEVLVHLGFRKIYMVGTGLQIDGDRPYAYESDLTAEERKYNQWTYKTVVRHTRSVNEQAPKYGLSLVSCTPDSALNKFLNYQPFDEALAAETDKVPSHQTTGLRRPSHSGLTGKPAS